MAEITEARPISKAAAFRVPHPAIRIWAGRGVWLGAGAFGLALLGLALLEDEPGRTWGAGLIVLAGALAVLAWGNTPWKLALVTSVPGERLLRLSWQRILRLLGIAGAGGLVWQADLAFQQKPYETFGQAGWLWPASMALL